MKDEIREIQDHVWAARTFDDGWILAAQSDWRRTTSEESTREGPETFRVEKWDAESPFTTDKEALDHVMASSSEICEYVRNILLQQLFWDT